METAVLQQGHDIHDDDNDDDDGCASLQCVKYIWVLDIFRRIFFPPISAGIGHSHDSPLLSVCQCELPTT